MSAGRLVWWSMSLPTVRSRPSTVAFVVGTGRSGSTALSRILNRHPEVLSVNELLTSVGERAFPTGELTGRQFWELLRAPNPLLDTLIRSGAQVPELIYPAAKAREAAETTGVPAICLTVLPHLTADPDALFDQLGAEIGRWPSRSAAGHYRELFGLLRHRFGGRVTVERSGHSLGWVATLREEFPDARFIHMYRDGADCALSMSKHPGFRLIYSFREIHRRTRVTAIAELAPGHIAALPAELSALFARRFDIATLMGRDIPLHHFGAMWAELIRDGVGQLAKVPADARADLRYEWLLGQPRAELRRLTEFLGIRAPDDWLDRARASLDRSRSRAAASLPAQELAELRAACAPGEECLDGAAAD